MRDFPMFTTEFGIASLILKEIPYREAAYIIIQDTLQPQELLSECVSFCRICGAEKVYARNHEVVETYPLYCSIYEMRGQVRVDESKVEHLWPVTEETVTQWRQIMNDRLRGIDNAGTLEKKEEKQILESGGAYFVHREGKLIGVGYVAEHELKLIASVIPGMGERVLYTLLSLVPDQEIRLEVASTNTRAIHLYEKAGFIRTAELRKWHQIV